MKFWNLSFIFILALFSYCGYAEQRTRPIELLNPDENSCGGKSQLYIPECTDVSSYTLFSAVDEPRLAIYFNLSYTNLRDYPEKWKYFRIEPGCKWRFHCGKGLAHISYDKFHYTPGVQNQTISIEPGKEYKFVFDTKTGILNLVEENPK